MRYPNIGKLIEIVNLYNTMIDISLCRITPEEDKTEPTRETKQLVHILEEESIGEIFSKITTRKMHKNPMYTNPREELSQEYQPHRKNYQQIPPKGLPTTSRYSPIITKTTRKHNY